MKILTSLLLFSTLHSAEISMIDDTHVHVTSDSYIYLGKEYKLDEDEVLIINHGKQISVVYTKTEVLITYTNGKLKKYHYEGS